MNTATLAPTISFTLSQLERTSQNWDKRTKMIVLFTSGGGNMFGGSGKGYVICLNGDNSTNPTGQIEILGVWASGYNIARGANGDNSGQISYWKGITDLASTYDLKPTFKIQVEGSCDTGKDTLCAILGADADYIVRG